MGYDSQKCFFLVQELLLDFAAWIDLTSNTETSISTVSVALEVTEHILLLQNVLTTYADLPTLTV